MDMLACPGCKERDARIAVLERRVAQLQQQAVQLQQQVAKLEARLKVNSTNSSTPPSANPPGTPKRKKKQKSHRQRGAQPGHPPHLKQLLPPEQVSRTVALVPDVCQGCHASLPAQPGPNDPEIKRFQTVELPPIPLEVVEYQAQGRTCPDCGHVNQATIPASVRAHSVGPRLTGTLAYLTGNLGMSKRNVEELVEDVFGVPIAVGTVANLEQEVSAVLEAPYQEARAAAQQAKVAFADETSWKLWGKLCWLWAVATANLAVFAVHAQRSALGFVAIVGMEFEGLLHSDRYHVYLQIPPERRQICWAHLKRDFQKVVDRGGASVFVGRRGLRLVKEVFAAWHAFQEGKVTRDQLQGKIQPLAARMNKALVAGAFGSDARVAKFCENLLQLEPALWTFVTQEGVEPTNNFMERLLRRAVLWRKRSFGCNSLVGCRYVERVLTVVQTCRLRNRNVLEYLHDAIRAHRAGIAGPALLS
jgi:transposase